jgi:formylglycine-generating enzyme required for sulfatase activity
MESKQLSVYSHVIENAEYYIGVDNVCAWPNLTQMPDGKIVTMIHNTPSHLLLEGDVDSYMSANGGRTWEFQSSTSLHKPGNTIGNLAAGLSHDGALIALIAGWEGKNFRENSIQPRICRSYDYGKTWKFFGVLQVPEGFSSLCVFGDVVLLDKKDHLAVPAYVYSAKQQNADEFTSMLFFSHDDGKTWQDFSIIGSGCNETSVLRLKSNRWLAASRTDVIRNTVLFVSEDEGKTWKKTGIIAGYEEKGNDEHPPHLLRLHNGNILVTFGKRWLPHGVGGRISKDEGETWGSRFELINFGWGDCGYPSSVQLDDETIVTAYYSSKNRFHNRYHMGVVRWSCDSIKERTVKGWHISHPSSTTSSRKKHAIKIIKAPDMIPISSGTYKLGFPDYPVRSVTLTYNFEISSTVITNGQYREFCDKTGRAYPQIIRPDNEPVMTPGYFEDFPQYPIVNVSWRDATEYCNWLSDQSKLPLCYTWTGDYCKLSFPEEGYRLPTDAEWEIASRAGKRDFKYPWGNVWEQESANLYLSHPGGKMVNFISYHGPLPVAAYKAEGGVYDMAGNVAEMCNDDYMAGILEGMDPHSDTMKHGGLPVLRGGSWADCEDAARCSNRQYGWEITKGDIYTGFRIVRRK